MQSAKAKVQSATEGTNHSNPGVLVQRFNSQPMTWQRAPSIANLIVVTWYLVGFMAQLANPGCFARKLHGSCGFSHPLFCYTMV